MTQTAFTVTSENGSSWSDISGLETVVKAIDAGGSNAAATTSCTTVARSVGLTSALTAIDISSASTLTIEGTNGIGGNG